MAEASTPVAVPPQMPPSDIQPRTADAPFNAEKAGVDVILRSSDKVDFYTHKLVLSLASPFFETAFLVPQPTDGSTTPSIPVVDIPEDSHALGLLLRCCYPLRPPTLSTLADVRCVLHAALKYEMDAARAVAETSLKDVVDEDPVGVFAIGCKCNREDVCQLAAKRLLAYSLQSFESEELHGLSAYPYNKLMQWHARCCTAASGTTSRRDWFRNCEVLTNGTGNCSSGVCWVRDPLADSERSDQWLAHQALWPYLRRAQLALQSCPSSVSDIASEAVLGGRLDFSEMLGREVDRVVSEVPIPKFCDTK
ncbi:hypothetical protein DENSPDRAFT_884723 [Dentipellis sp. KUC8613]|nr:hypothetical protein DENSPDRAFT_884723 [Dentipellis sp. KUC8613]